MIGETISHYRILEKLGEGGMGVVYKAEDTRLDRTVALKFLSEQALENEEERIRFVREAKVTASLDHPNICTIYEIGEVKGQAFIAMAYLDGQSLTERIEAGPLEVHEALNIAVQVAEALEEAHASGIVHRDIKSANIIMDGKDQARMMDFGLAKILGRTRLTKTATIMGTVNYMSPEQARGDTNIDHRTDIWSLGVLLYEMLTGKKPFDAANDAAVIHKIIYENASDIMDLYLDLPPEVNTIIERALTKDREKRYHSVAQFLEDVRTYQTLYQQKSIADSAIDSDPEQSLATPEQITIPLPPLLLKAERSAFVGRNEEMTRLRQYWAEAQEGHPQLLMLSGEPGIGKTRLAVEFALAAYSEGATVLYGGTEKGASFPYQPFVEAFRHYVAESPLSPLRLQVGTRESELTVLLPELAQRVPDLSSPQPADADSAQYRIFEGFALFLEKIVRYGPVVVVLDDLQWADEKTSLLLGHIVRSMTDSPVLLLGTYREMELGRAHHLLQVLADLHRNHSLGRISLKGLDEKEVSTLIDSCIGHNASESFVYSIREQTKGNPFFVEEILHHLVDTGAIYERDGSWMTALSVEQMGIPEGVKEVIGQRLLRLSEECNSILTVASVVGREFDLETLERASDLSTDRLLDLLEEAITARIIAEVPHSIGRYRFSHELFYETLCDELTTTRRVRLHGQTLRYADNNGVKVAYEVLGGTGPYLIAVGLSSCPAIRPRDRLISRQWERISRYCHVILYDRRGVGFTAAPPRGYSLLASAEDLRAVLDSVGVRRVVLWGATDGGPLAIAFAVKYPDRVAGLILAGTTAKLVNSEDFDLGINPVALDAFRREDSSDPGQAVSQVTRSRSGSNRAQAISEVLTRVPKEIWSKILGAIGAADVRTVLTQVQAPTLILHDPDNNYIPVGAAEYLHEHIPDSTLEISKDYGGMVMGDATYSTIETFIEEVTTRGSLRL